MLVDTLASAGVSEGVQQGIEPRLGGGGPIATIGQFDQPVDIVQAGDTVAEQPDLGVAVFPLLDYGVPTPQVFAGLDGRDHVALDFTHGWFGLW